MPRWIVSLMAPFLIVAAARAEDVKLARKAEEILVAHCLECHGSDQKGKLDLRTRELALKGGENGPAFLPGAADSSLLVDHVSGGVMPPEETLADAEIEVLHQWVQEGAKYASPRLDPYLKTTRKRAGYDWWSLRPIVNPPVPNPLEGALARAPIDAFVMAKLAEVKLSLSEEADRATYIRRVTYDLHGLPPSHAEISAFVHDTAPDAYERLVDRLLASPRFGERWGRHWLDVVRFAESNGFERDRIRTNFWRYRDYVIAAMNEDKPFDLFVKEQVAGDALHPTDPMALIATGFLVAGAKNDVGTVSELERLMTRQDELDDFVTATGTTFLGLTLGCARCHDHKFDPIPAKDYYSLTAVFSGLDRAENVVATPEEKAKHLAESNRVRKERVEATEAEIESLLLAAEQLADSESDATLHLPSVTVERNQDAFDPVSAAIVRFTIERTNTENEPCLDELEIYDDEGTNVSLASAGSVASASSLLPGFDKFHQVAHLNDGKVGNERSWISNEAGKGWVEIRFPQARKIHRVVWSRDRDAKFQDRLPTEYHIEVSMDGKEWREVSSSKLRPPYAPGGNESNERAAKLFTRLSPPDKARYLALKLKLVKAKAELDALPPLPVSYSAKDEPPRETFLLHRGEVRNRGEILRPAALSAIHGLDATLDEPAHDSGPARRLRLAEWLTNPANPLPARVIVNRVWHYHFGRGIVATPSDFGFQGERPTHPELLDWLASDLVANGWKLKRLHRMICLSRAYRQSSANRTDCAAVDAGNRYLWRFSPWRLDAESLRDSVLTVSGKLDGSIGGPSFRLFEYRDGNVPDYVLSEKSDPSTWRRGVYMFNIRTFREPLLAAFDCPDPSVQTPKREQSTTALQALSLMNNAFMVEQSGYFADRVREAGSQPREPILAAYQYALGRTPSDSEVERAIAFVQRHGLRGFCRVLFNTNEFLYVR